MITTIAIAQEQDVALLVRGPFPVPADMADSSPAEGYVRPTACFRGTFWLRAEEPAVLELEMGVALFEEAWLPAYLIARREGDSSLLDAAITGEADTDLLPSRIGELIEHWERTTMERRVPVGETVLWSQLAEISGADIL